MMGRLGQALRQGLIRLFPRREPVRPGRHTAEKEVIGGSAGNVIIVKSPNTEYFKEAIFILCDDLFTRRGVNRSQILREARRAAWEYTVSHTPARTHRILSHGIAFLLGAVSMLAVLLLFF